jgi:hypothetical protein
MSIRFGWTRPQAQPETSDEHRVENVSPVATGADRAPQPEHGEHVSGYGSPDADIPTGPAPTGQSATRQSAIGQSAIGTPVTTPTPEAVRSIWEVHARVVETERKSHRRLGAAAARRSYHEALVEEAAALHDLGFDSYDAFAAVHGAAAPADETEAVAPSEPAPNSSGNSFGGAFGAPLGEPTTPPVVESQVTS